MPLTSDNIQVFLAVLDHGSFSAAARAIGRVPSAVSMAIAQLEAELDFPLFDRSGREPRPTDAARALEPRARHLASQLRQLQADAASLHSGLERRLTLAVVPELTSGRWSEPLATLAEEFPSLELEVLSAPQGDALRMLHDGTAQLAVVFERERLDEREGLEEIASDHQIAVMSAAHGRGPGVRPAMALEDLIDVRQVVVASRDSAHGHARLAFSRHTWRTDSPHTALNLVQAGIGWAFLPRALAGPRVADGSLVEIAFTNVSENHVSLWVDVVWSRDRPLGLAARRYIALCRERRLQAG